MLASERQDAIVELVNENGSVLVKDLSVQFEVTEDSIRKDLTLLEKKGLLKKTYGGAVKVRVNPHELYVSQRIGKNTSDKIAIAKAAVEMIEDGDVIFLDISTSNLELAKLIVEKDLNITLVTNMIDAMVTASASNSANIIFIGGTLNRGRDGFVGSMTDRQIKEFRFDKAFIGVVGVNLEQDDVYTYAPRDGVTKTQIMKSSNKKYLMLESRKFSAYGNFRYAGLSDLDGVILDRAPDEKIRKKCFT